MRVINGCEESQAVTIEMRNLGHEAYSCDTESCSGGHPEWHIKGDIFLAINGGHLTTQAGNKVFIYKWDLGLFFPPCTFLTVTANRAMVEDAKSMFPIRQQQRKDAADFFMALYNADIPKIAIENPVGVMSTIFRKPDQIIQPYWFGDKHSKKTCLWLKNLPKLQPTEIVEPEMYTYKNGKKDPMWHFESIKLPKHERSKFRSKTYQGIAKAMAEQWTK